MLEVFVKYICFIIMTLTGAFAIKRILNEKIKIITLKNIFIIFFILILPTILYRFEYSSINTAIILCLNIIIYKLIFNKGIVETILLSCSIMILSFVADMLTFVTVSIIINLEKARTIWYMMLISNIVSSLYCLLLIRVNQISNILNKVCKKIKNSTYISNILFIVLTFIVLCLITKNLYVGFIFADGLIRDLFIVLGIIILIIIYLKEKNSYDKLSKEYDVMFEYVNEFAEWVEKEQFNRHEYKNQLAVLYCITKEKKVKDKINEILEDNINLEGKIIHELKVLPKSGIKGLMYYKSAIAQKNKIDLTINVSIELKSLLKKLNDEEIKTICKLIGIYYDNAIEAASETKNKIVLVEIYELKDKVSFVFSNTFKKHDNFNDRYKKGVSSKGEGHGNGLYFASKLLEKNKFLESKQEIIDKYYIQQLIIRKK